MINFKYVHKGEESNMQDDFFGYSFPRHHINNVQNLSQFGGGVFFAIKAWKWPKRHIWPFLRAFEVNLHP